MESFEDHYKTIQVDFSAEPEVIKAAYTRLAQKYHPDKNQSTSATATEKMTKINKAYEILGDPIKRKKYDVDWLQRKGGTTSSSAYSGSHKPKPIIDPPGIIFKNIKPGETKKTSFLIINTGGPYTKINISNPDSWLKILDWHSISQNDELPLRVNILAQADNSGKKRSENIYIKLDDVQTSITILLEPKIRLEINDHKWHNVEFENLNKWAQEQATSGEIEFIGKIFAYRLNNVTKKYQFRLRHRYKSAIYDP